MGIHKLLRDADITLDAMFPMKKAALAFVADRLAHSSGMEYASIKAALAGREALGSTAVGRGVAVPHLLSPSCTEPVAALVRLANPIFFDTPDGVDVDILFALIWPSQTGNFHKTVAAICRLLRDPRAMGKIRSLDQPEAIRDALLDIADPEAPMTTERLALI